mgnify:CR=1 FL=1
MKNVFEMAKVISGYSRKEAERRYEVCRDRFTDGGNTLCRDFDLVMEASMLSQRIVDIAKEEVKADAVSNEPDINTDAWIQVPVGDDMKFWLNKYGLRRWKAIDDNGINAQRPYYWCDRVIIMNDRTVIDDITFTEFIRLFGLYVPEMPELGKEIKPQS